MDGDKHSPAGVSAGVPGNQPDSGKNLYKRVLPGWVKQEVTVAGEACWNDPAKTGFQTRVSPSPSPRAGGQAGWL